jgi:hypothetical protein
MFWLIIIVPMKIANNKPPIVDDACAVHEKKLSLGVSSLLHYDIVPQTSSNYHDWSSFTPWKWLSMAILSLSRYPWINTPLFQHD